MLTDQDKELLIEHHSLSLPESIEQETYLDFLYALKKFRAANPTEELHLYCRSGGGDTRSAMAMVDLIQSDGKVVGHLVGDVCSSAAAIWAACPKRIVYPNGMLFVHPVSWNDIVGVVDASRLWSMWQEFNETDWKYCNIYASASNKDKVWWHNQLNPAGDGSWFDAKTLIEMEMGQWPTKAE